MLGATLRMARDLDIAEEATADAFVLALQTWPERGVPDSVEAWLLTAARRRAIDRIRRLGRFRERLAADRRHRRPDRRSRRRRRSTARRCSTTSCASSCCAATRRLDIETQVALTMRLGCGVPTASIAAAFLVPEPTMAARLTRAKKRIAGSGHRHRACPTTWPSRSACRRSAARSTSPTRWATPPDRAASCATTTSPRTPCAWPARCTACVPTTPRPAGLLALILLTEARAGTRLAADGTQVLLADADRRRWDGAQRRRGPGAGRRPPSCPSRSARSGRSQGHNAGPLVLQAAIAAEHARAATFADTDWAAIVGLYDALLTIEPSPTIALGRCVAMSYLIGPAAGLADLDEVIAVGGLDRYPYAHAARAQMLERLGRAADAAEAWAVAAACARTDAERTFFATRA